MEYLSKHFNPPKRTASLLFACLTICFVEGRVSLADDIPDKCTLLRAAQVTETYLDGLRLEGFQSVALMLTDTNATPESRAARRVNRSGLKLDYWIEIGRCPWLADKHPEWMASIQTHDEWRRFFPEFPKAGSNEVVKAYPWVPALYRETFDVHLQRVFDLLQDKPQARRLFLNDLQGPPSACGCGHPLCRWTTDYGPLASATRLPADAAARFVAAIRKRIPGVEIIPVWTTECEAHDKDGLCAGVGCFRGACWREWTAQLTPLGAESAMLGVLLPYRAFQRDLPEYGRTAGWISRGLNYFTEMPARYGSKGIPANRLIAVVQGWDVTPAQVAEQTARVIESKAAGIVIARTEIEQDWQPRLHSLRSIRPR